MKSVSMSGSPRASVGKKDAKKLRTEGKVPCVLYGGAEQVSFSVDEKQFKSLVYTPDVHTVEIDVNGKKYKAILQDLQTHPVTDKIIHADFVEVVSGKPVIMSLPVRTTGTAPGVKAGGKLLKKLRKVSAKGTIDKMPDAITIEIGNMNIGDAVTVRDLKYDGITFLTPASSTIVTCQVTRNVAEEEPAKTAAATPAAGAPAAAATPAAAPAKDEKKK
jgi:large subunit ribosomal protein L25